MAQYEARGSVEENEIINLHFHTRASISPTDLQALPSFENDSRDLPLFIDSCEEFLDTYRDKMNPNNPLNTYLIKLIKSKLDGDAKYLVWIRECKTWQEIKGILEANFGDKRTEDNLFSDLINFKCDGGRDFHAMGIEIRTLLGLLLAKTKLVVENPQELQIKEQLYSKVALDTYLRNLYFYDKDLANPVRFQNPKTLDEAMELVAEEMNWQYSCSRLENTAPPRQPMNYSYGIPAMRPAFKGKSVNANFAQKSFFPQSQTSGLFGSQPPSSAPNVMHKAFGSSNVQSFGAASTEAAGFSFGGTAPVFGSSTVRESAPKLTRELGGGLFVNGADIPNVAELIKFKNPENNADKANSDDGDKPV